jgi:hypothetical protein
MSIINSQQHQSEEYEISARIVQQQGCENEETEKQF